jgi:hypothetical protein
MVTLEVVGLEKLDKLFGLLPSRIEGGVKLAANVAVRGLVWEWGIVDINPGPKTQYSTNPDGAEVVLTIQAPHGWIRVNRQQYIQFLKEEWNKVSWATLKASEWEQAIHDMLWAASSRCARLMEDTAPVDTGDLRSGIIAVNEPDPILEQYGGELDLGSGWL